MDSNSVLPNVFHDKSSNCSIIEYMTAVGWVLLSSQSKKHEVS